MGNKLKKDICVISYPDYKDTEIYMKTIGQLKDLNHSFTELSLDTFDTDFNNYTDDKFFNGKNVISVGGDGTALKGMYLSYLSDSVLLPDLVIANSLNIGQFSFIVGQQITVLLDNILS